MTLIHDNLSVDWTEKSVSSEWVIKHFSLITMEMEISEEMTTAIIHK